MTLRRAAGLALVLTGIFGPVVGSASALTVIAPVGLAQVGAYEASDESGYRVIYQEHSRLTGPMTLGGVPYVVDLTIDPFSCGIDQPDVDPPCPTHTVALTGTARKHPTATQPLQRKYDVGGTCAMPSSYLKSAIFIHCDVLLGNSSTPLGMTVRVTVGTPLDSDNLVPWCSLDPQPPCPSPGIDVGPGYGSAYQQR